LENNRGCAARHCLYNAMKHEHKIKIGLADDMSETEKFEIIYYVCFDCGFIEKL